MADTRENEIVFRALHESPIVSVHDYCCHIERSGPGAEEESGVNNEFGHPPSEVRQRSTRK